MCSQFLILSIPIFSRMYVYRRYNLYYQYEFTTKSRKHKNHFLHFNTSIFVAIGWYVILFIFLWISSCLLAEVSTANAIYQIGCLAFRRFRTAIFSASIRSWISDYLVSWSESNDSVNARKFWASEFGGFLESVRVYNLVMNVSLAKPLYGLLNE